MTVINNETESQFNPEISMLSEEEVADSANSSDWSVELNKLQEEVEADPSDLVAKISLASALEHSGKVTEAVSLYEAILTIDGEEGVFGASASKALETLTAPLRESGEAKQTEEKEELEVYSPEIRALQATLAEDPENLVTKLTLASCFEAEGYIVNAIALYQEVITVDGETGVFGGSASKAVENLTEETPSPEDSFQSETLPLIIEPIEVKETLLEEEKTLQPLPKPRQTPTWQRFSHLPLIKQQVFGILGISIIGIISVVGASIFLTIGSGQKELENQTRTELALVENNYNGVLQQIQAGLRGQSNNTAIIAANRAFAENGTLGDGLSQLLTQILIREQQAQQLESLILLAPDGSIIASNGRETRESIPLLAELVTEIQNNLNPVQATALLDRQALAQITPVAEAENSLARFVAVPVQDPVSDDLIGILIGIDLLNNDSQLLLDLNNSLTPGYTGIYYLASPTELTLATSVLKTGSDQSVADIALADSTLSEIAIGVENITPIKITNNPYTIAVKPLANLAGEPVAFLVRGRTQTGLRDSIAVQMVIALLTLVVVGILAVLFGRRLNQPLQALNQSALSFIQGEENVRFSGDYRGEMGELAHSFNEMAERLNHSQQYVDEQIEKRMEEVDFQRQERERLQEDVIRLLLDIEGARAGDLSVRAQVDEGEVGSIADAFNATLSSLCLLVRQVQNVSNQVNQSTQENDASVQNLSQNATQQAEEVRQALDSVEGMARSVQLVASSAKEAANISHQSRLAAQKGQQSMDQTVRNIENIRTSVSETSKKAKRLAESSQEISTIVNIISEISEKTNLLAFNASIEAARAGENGQGFRVVASEVRRLAEQVTFSAQDIEKLISGIQQETAQMVQTMEESTTQVVTGTKLVKNTKRTLQQMIEVNQEIDLLLESISASTVSQTETSQELTRTMQDVAVVAKNTSSESQGVSTSLQKLVQIVGELQESASRFKIES